MAKIEHKHLFPRPAHRICKNCKWWDSPSSTFRGTVGRCKKGITNTGDWIDFGCNKWEKKG